MRIRARYLPNRSGERRFGDRSALDCANRGR
jgi:hypothetical protein